MKVAVVILLGVVAGCSVGPLEVAGLYTNRAYGHTFAAHKAFVCYFFGFLFVAPSEEPYHIYRRVFEVLLLRVHRAGIYAYSAA